MKKVGIVGSGFSGIMTISHLINKSDSPIEIILIDNKGALKGAAYNPYSEKHLLNVITGKMSAYKDRPDHFLNWVMSEKDFETKDRNLIKNSFLPRKLYGKYLADIWQETLQKAKLKKIKITLIDGLVTDLDISGDSVSITTDGNLKMNVDYCILATGNQIPRNPNIQNNDFYNSKNYFQNPWKVESVDSLQDKLPILIIGNGLTMVDTLFGLLEQGFKGEILSISPNGFNVLPHRHNGLAYTKLIEELPPNPTLFELMKLVHKHIKAVRDYGVSAEPVIDSLRPHVQKIWKSFSQNEKEIFMSRLRHLWGVARHRIPLHSHDKIQQLRIERRLNILSGKLINLTESDECITVEYFDKKKNQTQTLKVSRVINCTGPESDFMKLENSFLKKCLLKGILSQDKLKLGINTDTETFQVINSSGEPHSNLFTLGTNLRGELWESTAVNELRDQAEKLAERLIK